MGAAHSANSGSEANAGASSTDATVDVRPAADAARPSDTPATEHAGQARATPTARERSLPVIAGYEILGELGRGGMGVVYRARQTILNRPCVLKMILAGAHADTEAALRFLAEAEAVARVQHPNVVHIHHVGQSDGLPFLELEFVEGGSLDRRLDGTPWAPRRAAELVEALAQGVAAAHHHGIVHRDLKPGNVLMATGGVPKITDFGLAKSLTVESGLTQTGQILGSPGYMAPEQAEGNTRHVGPAADVYALCAILYELLTGRPPFRGATVLETLEQARSAEPVPPSRLVPGLPRDIETITLKGLRKEPDKRYDSAEALAADLRRFISGESIVARPAGPVERSWRWCRRHPGSASLTAVVILVALAGVAGIVWEWQDALAARDLAAQRAVAEADARRQVELTLADMYTTSGILAGDQGEHARAALWFANAARLARADRQRQRANAIRARTWGRLALTPQSAVVADDAWPGALVIHPGGRHLLTTALLDGQTRDARYTLWDPSTEQSLPFPGGGKSATAAAWSPDGHALAVGGADGEVILASFPDGKETARIPFPGRVRLVTYSADGRYLAIAGGNTARVWDCRAAAFATPELAHPAAVTTLALHPEGRSLATGCRDELARLFTVGGAADKPAWPPVPHVQMDGAIWFPVFFAPPLFVDDGRALLTYSGKGGLSYRNVETGAELRTVDSPEQGRRIAAATLSPNGRYLAISYVQRPAVVRLFEVATGRAVGEPLAHANTVFDVAFSPDSSLLLTSSSDNTVQLWNLASGKSVGRRLDLHRTIHRVAFAADGRALVTQDADLVRIWALPQPVLPTMRAPLDPAESFVTLSRDGRLVLPTGVSIGDRQLRSTRPYRIATGEAVGPPLRPGGFIVDAAFSPDGATVAIVAAPETPKSAGSDVQAWDWSSGQRRWRTALPAEPRSVAYHNAGDRLVVLCASGELLVLSASDGGVVHRWQSHEPEWHASHWINNGKAAYSPDGSALLIWGMGNDVHVLDAETGALRYPPLVHREKCHDLQFSANGKLMALASYDHSVRIHDFLTGSVIAELPPHPDLVYTAHFSLSGEFLVTACRDRGVRVWDWRARRLVCPPFEHTRDATAALFTRDGQWVLSISDDATFRVWDWHNGKPITPALNLGSPLMSLAVSPDSKHAMVGGFGNALVILELADLNRAEADPAILCLRAELVAGQRIHEGGGTANLSAAEWLQRWRDARRR